MDKGQVKFIRPKHPELQKYIKGYYLHKALRSDFNSFITFYQNITTTISIYKNTHMESDGRRRAHTYKEGTGFTSLLVGKVDKYQEVEIKGLLDRFAVVFYPVGINHFIDVPLSDLVQLHFSRFTHFDDDFEKFLPVVFDTDSLEKKRDLFDEFLLSKFKPFKENRILLAVEQIVSMEESIKVQEISDTLGMSRRTLLRLFQKHLAYSPEEYISVVKFRKALLNFQKNQEDHTLADIAYDSSYYDQADFNHQLKTRSGLTPKTLFSTLEIVDDVLFWNRNSFDILSQFYNQK